MERFPHQNPFEFEGIKFEVDWVEQNVKPLLTEDRLQRIDHVVSGRTYSITCVLENIYDRGNSSAVMRSAEGLGIQSIHHIEINDRFKAANRVTKGADKWLDQFKWSSTPECVDHLKQKGYQIVATSLQSDKPLAQIDGTIPTALVIGNEKDGISREMQDRADELVVLPMTGFVQSFNLSVAGALSLYHCCNERLQKLGYSGDLSSEQQRLLKAIYYCKSHPETAVSLRQNAIKP